MHSLIFLITFVIIKSNYRLHFCVCVCVRVCQTICVYSAMFAWMRILCMYNFAIWKCKCKNINHAMLCMHSCWCATRDRYHKLNITPLYMLCRVVRVINKFIFLCAGTHELYGCIIPLYICLLFETYINGRMRGIKWIFFLKYLECIGIHCIQ